MATTCKTTKSTKSKSNKTEKGILEQFLAELDKEIDAKEAGISRKMTKGQALVKSMINEALKGDQRMLGNVLKLIEKLDLIEEEEKPDEEEKHSKGDWELMFAFFGKYEKLIKQEIERLKETNPSYWNFGDWLAGMTFGLRNQAFPDIHRNSCRVSICSQSHHTAISNIRNVFVSLYTRINTAQT